ncbi:MAG: DUF1846 domain-containing protein [Clostridia bacterium]|nr:DUF1846 domain-containing protein [Clostridia bacterium]MBO4428797.1 DUF1846 domain-containing protein [Clostridia bacterium]
MQKGFDNDKYIRLQSERIRERIKKFGGKLYLEFGGKLFDDFHASRVLPGFEPDSKIRMLENLSSDAEIIICISADDIEKSKVRSDLDITYDEDVLRLIGVFRKLGFYVGSVVITKYASQAAADIFRKRLAAIDVRSFLHYPIAGYPSDIKNIVSENGYGKNDYIETERPLVVVTAPGPGSGKMATCLSQLYHEYKRGIKAGYAKFETFPIWNLPLRHPVNVAYEAATADLNDINMIDPFQLEAYGQLTVNYNRDVEIFPVLRAMLEQIQGESPYKSPTDMGVNMAGFCIYDDEVVSLAAKKEILRRYYKAAAEYKRRGANGGEVEKLKLLMNQSNVTPDLCPAIAAALKKAEETDAPAAAMQLESGQMITGKTSSLLGAAAALTLNALKALAGIDKETDIISPSALEPICTLKTKYLHHRNPRLHSDEVLLALSISSATSEDAAKALSKLDELRGLDAHFSVIPSRTDEKIFKRLGINLTSEPQFEKKR